MFNNGNKPYINVQNRQKETNSAGCCGAQIDEFFEPFLLSKQAANCKPATIQFYSWQLSYFFKWLKSQQIFCLPELTSGVIRGYIADCLKTRAQGGVYTSYNAIRTYLLWVWDEYEFETPNPIKKVKCSQRPRKPISGIPIELIDTLFAECENGRMAKRDKAMIAVLIDTGIRRRELYEIRYGDVNIILGTILIRRGKSNLSRIAYLGKRSRKLLRQYTNSLEKLPAESSFWKTESGDDLSMDGMRQILRRIQKRAKLDDFYSFHDFRRCFALEAWRNGADYFGVAELLGQISVASTDKYIDSSDDDRRLLHAKFAPMNNRK